MDRAKIVACLSLLLAAGCARPPRIVVGSKNFTEQVLLGEILAQQIERRLGVAVDRRLNLGGTMLAHEALVDGDIDLYPEYTGTALTAVLKQAPQGGQDAGAALAEVRAAYAARWQIAWLSPLGFNDTFAMIVAGPAARAGQLATISQAAAKRAWRMGVGYEFQQRPDGLEGLLKAYGLRQAGAPVSMDLGLLYAALQSGKVDMIAANSTDGLASVLDVKILEDDRRYFPQYQCAVLARERTLAGFPRLRPALEELAGKIDDAEMRHLNYAVDGQHRPVAEVAAEFLEGVGGQVEPRRRARRQAATPGVPGPPAPGPSPLLTFGIWQADARR
jgi:glycine betaine/choline ABC-type transport system substrate-binding protein